VTDTEGWLKLYRCLIEKPIWKLSTPEQKAILITLLCMVNHEEEEWEWKGTKYICKPGQKITSLKNIKKECGKGISIQNIRTAITRFEKVYQFLTNESTKESRLITVLNWELYQSGVKNQQSNQQTCNKGVTTNKNDKNDKNIKEIYKEKIESFTNNSELQKALFDFYEMRSKTKSPIKTENTIGLLLKELNKLSPESATQIEIVNRSTMNGWAGLFPLNKLSSKSQNKPPQQGNFEQREYEDSFYDSLYKNGKVRMIE